MALHVLRKKVSEFKKHVNYYTISWGLVWDSGNVSGFVGTVTGQKKWNEVADWNQMDNWIHLLEWMGWKVWNKIIFKKMSSGSVRMIRDWFGSSGNKKLAFILFCVEILLIRLKLKLIKWTCPT